MNAALPHEKNVYEEKNDFVVERKRKRMVGSTKQKTELEMRNEGERDVLVGKDVPGTSLSFIDLPIFPLFRLCSEKKPSSTHHRIAGTEVDGSIRDGPPHRPSFITA